MSILLNRSVIEEHAEDAATLWRMHEHAVDAPLYRLRDLALLDERIVAHLEGLRTAGTAGLAVAQRGLATGTPGAVFVVAYLAFLTADREAMRKITQVAVSSSPFMGALIAAMSWLDFTAIEETLRLLNRSANPEYRRIAISVTAAHRVAAEEAYRTAAVDDNVSLRCRALRAIGETKSLNLEPLLWEGIQLRDVRCRFWAAWSLALFGDQTAAVDAFKTGIDVPALCRAAIEIAMRVGEPGWAQDVIRSFAREESTVRRAIVAAGAFGDPAVIPWLMTMVERPALARVAAEAIATVTGVDLEAAEFKQDPPEDVPDEHDDDGDLRWPSIQGLTAWWQKNERRFTPGQRFLAGEPVSEEGALRVLRHGYQRQRGGAAIEIARLRREAILFPIAARADRQLRRLGV